MQKKPQTKSLPQQKSRHNALDGSSDRRHNRTEKADPVKVDLGPRGKHDAKHNWNKRCGGVALKRAVAERGLQHVGERRHARLDRLHKADRHIVERDVAEHDVDHKNASEWRNAVHALRRRDWRERPCAQADEHN